MIVVRDIFQLKFGKAREAKELWKEGIAKMKNNGFVPDRLLSDVTGPYYTVVMESTFDSLADFEKSAHEAMSDEWRNWYQKFVPIVDSGRREIFTVEHSK
jgi:hypothetical protein